MVNFIRHIRYKYFCFNKWKTFQRKYPDCIIAERTVIKGNIVLEGGNQIGNDVILTGNISIGKATFINGPSILSSPLESHIKIGRFCSIANYTKIFASNHSLSTPSTFNTANGKYRHFLGNNGGKNVDIVIGSDVWIGTDCIVLSGVSIGHGAVIAAGSVVTKNVPAFHVVGGNPAKTIRKRFSDEIIELLLELAWWDWSDDRIKNNTYFFTRDISILSREEIVKMIKN